MLSRLQKYTTLVLFFFLHNLYSHAAVVIFEIYGAGGNTGAIYQDDFVVLYNSGSSSQSLNGWSLQYAAATGSSWDVLNLPNQSIPANGYYFIRLQTTNTIGAALNSPNLTTTALGSTTTGISATQGKLALMRNTATISGTDPQIAPNTGLEDFVGYGGANAFEGSAAASSPSTTSVIHRKLPAHQDTNNNNNDFVVRSQVGVTSFPVNYVNFEAIQKEFYLELSWQTASETNNEGFSIQKSSDAKNFETIAFVKGENEKSEYNFIDPYPFEGYNYYRLEQKDFDGTKTYSKIISVLFLPDGEINIYPNPAVAGENISITGLPREGNYEIFKLNGQKVNSNVLKLTSGEYFIKVYHPFGFESKRLIVR